MTLKFRSRSTPAPRRRFVCGACDTDLTRLTRPGPSPKDFGLCCEAMALVPSNAFAARPAH